MSDLRRRLEEAEERLRTLIADGLTASESGLDREETERCRLVAERIERKALAVGSAFQRMTATRRAA